jgi:integrase
MATLTAKRVDTQNAHGRYSDGSNLYLQVTKSGSKSWLFIYRWNKLQKEMGLGPYPAIGLADAREAARNALKLLKDRNNPQDPLAVRRAEQDARREKPAFGVFAEQMLSDIELQWRNPKHRAQWRFSLREYGKPIWDMSVNDIDTQDILRVLKPIWQTIPETASRLRGRVERVLDAAAAKGLRTGANPARWKGHLDHLLPKRHKLTRGHHAAMPYDQVPKFVTELRQRDNMSALALEFLILCAARSGEVLGMTWEEVDVVAKVWTVPARRMKAGREHRVPLSDRGLAILNSVRPLSLTLCDKGLTQATGFVFRGLKMGPLSVMSLTMQMRRMEKGHFTPHGFRSAFRDWCGEETDFAREIAEAALAHTVGDMTERA